MTWKTNIRYFQKYRDIYQPWPPNISIYIYI